MKTKEVIIKIRSFVSPFFLSKFYITHDVKKVIRKYKFTGDLLDFGCGSKPYKKYFTGVTSYKGIDFKLFSVNRGHSVEEPDYYFPENYLNDFKLEFEDETFDVTTAFQVLEHHQKPQAMISELYRLTKKGGHILITVPFLGGLHEEPYDYQRYTKYGLRELFRIYDCEVIEIMEQGSVFSTVAMLINQYINYLVVRGSLSRVVGLLIFIPMVVFQYLTLLLDKVFRSEKICFNYLILVRKND